PRSTPGVLVALRPCRHPRGTGRAGKPPARAAVNPAPPAVALLSRGHAERVVRRLRPRARHDAALRARAHVHRPDDPLTDNPGPGGPHGVRPAPDRRRPAERAERAA